MFLLPVKGLSCDFKTKIITVSENHWTRYQGGIELWSCVKGEIILRSGLLGNTISGYCGTVLKQVYRH